MADTGMEFQSLLKKRLDEQESLDEQEVARADQCILLLVQAIEEMRALGADIRMIVDALQVAINTLRDITGKDGASA